MRLRAFHAKGIEPTKLLSADNLSDVVVVAGPNGVGKTRFINWLINFFRSIPSNNDQWVEIEATSPEERAEWGQDVLDTRKPVDAQKLRAALQKNRPRGKHVGSILNFENDRSIAQIQPYQFTWDYQDPFQEMVGWDSGLNQLRNRFQDTLHSIFRKVRSRRETIALKVEELSAR